MTEKTTPQPSTPPAKSPFMTRYVMGWAVLASVSLVYLALLAFQPELVARQLGSAGATSAVDEREQAMAQAISEVQSLRDAVSQFREELIALRSEVSSQSDRDRDILERIAALEAPPAPVAAAKSPPAAQQKTAAAAPPKAPQAKKQAAPAVGAPQSALETGSVAAPAAGAVTFGPAVVTPAAAPPAAAAQATAPTPGKSYGVQIATGPSVDSLRLSWTLLAERHGGSLAALQPRYTMGADEQGVAYNLVAGPVSSPAEAQKLCAELAAKATPCAPTTFRGDAL